MQEYLDQENCIKAINKGYILKQRGYGITVYLFKGKQIISSKKRSRPYEFDHPNHWYIDKRLPWYMRFVNLFYKDFKVLNSPTCE